MDKSIEANSKKIDATSEKMWKTFLLFENFVNESKKTKIVRGGSNL